jgi:hypothetical protein
MAIWPWFSSAPGGALSSTGDMLSEPQVTAASRSAGLTSFQRQQNHNSGFPGEGKQVESTVQFLDQVGSRKPRGMSALINGAGLCSHFPCAELPSSAQYLQITSLSYSSILLLNLTVNPPPAVCYSERPMEPQWHLGSDGHPASHLREDSAWLSPLREVRALLCPGGSTSCTLSLFFFSDN